MAVSKGLTILLSPSIKAIVNYSANNSSKIAFGVEGAVEGSIGATIKSCAIGSCIAGLASFFAGTAVDYFYNKKDFKTSLK